MAFVRTKRQGGRLYHQLVESRREGMRVRQRVIVHLGPYPSVEEAIAGYGERAAFEREEERTWRAWAEAERITIERIRERVRPDLVGADIPRLDGRKRPQYWRYLDGADGHGRCARKLEARVEKLRRRCSAQAPAPVGATLGTTGAQAYCLKERLAT